MEPVFIRKSLDVVASILKADTAAILQAMETPRDPLRGVGRAFTGLMPAAPYAWVMPRSTAFDDTTNPETQQDLVTVKIGITGGDPEAVAEAALDYVAAVDRALRDADYTELDPTILHLHVHVHDYGPLFEGKGAFARFPEIHLEVTRVEVLA
jgi:hypothetical protein